MKVMLKRFLSKEFLITFVITYLILEGIEALVTDIFQIDLAHLGTLFGLNIGLSPFFTSLGFVVVLGFKFHILCCIIPTTITTLVCIRKDKHKCTDCHDHSKDS